MIPDPEVERAKQEAAAREALRVFPDLSPDDLRQIARATAQQAYGKPDREWGQIMLQSWALEDAADLREAEPQGTVTGRE